MDIIDRLNELIKHEGLNIASFAEKIGCKDNTIRQIVANRRNNPSTQVLTNIAYAFPWLDLRWLLTGEGTIVYQTKEVEFIVSELMNYMREKDKKIEILIAQLEKQKVNNKKKPD